ncbi:MAG: hypothetical protein IT450_15500 [Phycisphaerales bacterium]|nr:hypothetical protein [Phycisphaerales bacterium]
MSQLLTSTRSIWQGAGSAGDGIREYETTSVLQRRREAWRRLIDFTLVEWGRDPQAMEDDDVIPPSQNSVSHSIRLASQLAENDAPPPTRVVPNGDGGIVFERIRGEIAETIEVESDGSLYFTLCQGSRLVHRAKWA